MLAGSPPRAIATGIRSPRAAMSRQCAAPTLWRCQCMASVLPPEHLDPVHPDVADAARRVGGDHHRKGDVAPAVAGPGGEEGDLVEIDRVAAKHHLVAGRPPAADLGWELAHLRQLGEHRQLPEESLGHLEIEQLRDPAPDGVELVHAERETHPPERAVEVDGDRVRAPPPVLQEHVLEQERGAAAGALHAPVGDLGDLQPRAHRVGDPRQLAELVDGGEEFTEVGEGHGSSAPGPDMQGAYAAEEQAPTHIGETAARESPRELGGRRERLGGLW